MPSENSQSGHLKRKRQPSEQSSEDDVDIENLPTNEEKKFKDDTQSLPSCSFEREGDHRLPFSELKMVPQDSNIDTLVSDHERLSLSDDPEIISILSNPLDATPLSELSQDTDANSDDTISCIDSPASTIPSSRYEDLYESMSLRTNPLPGEVLKDLPSLWRMMCEFDEESVRQRDPELFSRHPGLQPRMRAVLLDWICEVCEVYKMHRDTFYITVDYIDRFLSSQDDLPKQQLQLIGITCLELANKNEEVYPPKMAEYAYVTDGACTQQEIVDTELIVCTALEWRLSPVTPLYWLNLFLQTGYHDKSRHNMGFFYPQFSAKLYLRAANLLDLCILDVGSLRFSYSVLAATVLYITCNTKLALKVSGLDENDLRPCIQWMTPFWTVLKNEVPEYCKKIKKLPPGFNEKAMYDNEHNIQVHDVSLTMLDAVAVEIAKQAPSCLLTPPSSSKKITTQEHTPA